MEHFFETIDGWSSMNDQGFLLNVILDEIKSPHLNIMEIGVYKGRMTALWNVILINKELSYSYIGIDHFKGNEEHIKNIDYYSIAIQNLAPIRDRIELKKEYSQIDCNNYPNEYFDIIYIDGEHDYYSVQKDISNWLPLLKYGGIMCGDDYIKGWPGVIEAVKEMFSVINKVGEQQWWIKKERI